MRNGIPKGKKCTIYKYEILPNSGQREKFSEIMGKFKKGKRSFVLSKEGSFSLKELELHIADVPDPVEVVWSRFRPDIVNTLTITQENSGRYYAIFKTSIKKNPQPKTYPKLKRSRQSNIGRAGITYHPR